MNFLTRCVLLAFLLGIFYCSYAQTAPPSVKGVILTVNRLPIDNATITLLNAADSSIVKSTISDKAGSFEFLNIKPAGYIIFAHKVGFARLYTGKYELTEKGLYVGTITLQILSNSLSEVTVTDKRDYIEVTPDKTVLNVDKSILAAGNSVYDVINTAPGVRIVNNQVQFKGGQKALITINGKAMSGMSDEQLAEMLKSYQSSMVSKIELIENPSARYDAEGGGVINIVLKKSKDLGFKANITGSAAYGQDYKTTTGINMNYRCQKINFFGNFSVADVKLDRLLNLDRIIGDENLDVNYKSESTTKNIGFNGGFDYDISPSQTIGVLVHGYHNNIGIDKHNVTNISNNGVLDSDITTQSHIDRRVTNLNYNLNYKGTLDKAGKSALSADFDYSTYDRSSFEGLANDFFDVLTDQTYRDPLFYLDNSPSTINIRSEKVDFIQTLSKTATLALGVKNSQVNSNNTIDFAQKDAFGTYIPVEALTDSFIYKERINAAYVNFSNKFKNASLTLGLRAEQTSSSGISLNPNKTSIRSYFNLFPNIQVTQNLDKDNQLTIGYNRRLTRPNYQDLNPFVAYIDQYAYNVGNPFLKPEYFDTYQITDLYKDKYKATLSVIRTGNFFVSLFQQNDSTKVYTTTNSNIGTRYQYMAEFWLPVDVTQWWKMNVYLEGGYSKYNYGVDSASKSAWDATIQLTQNFSITKNLKAEVTGEYDSPTYYGISQLKSLRILSAGISQSILDGNGSVKLAVSDIFNTNEYRYTSHYLNLDLTGVEKAGSRFVTATFTYRFGNQTVKNARRRVGGNFDEQQRLGGSSNEN